MCILTKLPMWSKFTRKFETHRSQIHYWSLIHHWSLMHHFCVPLWDRLFSLMVIGILTKHFLLTNRQAKYFSSIVYYTTEAVTTVTRTYAITAHFSKSSLYQGGVEFNTQSTWFVCLICWWPKSSWTKLNGGTFPQSK